jgi:hypothetical protein
MIFRACWHSERWFGGRHARAWAPCTSVEVAGMVVVKLPIALVLGLVVGGCGGGSKSPTAPTAPPIVTVAGHVTATNGGQPLSGLAVRLTTNQTTMTGSNGDFAFELPRDGSVRWLTLEGSSIVERVVTLGTPTSRTIEVDAIVLTAGFDLEFYRRFVRRAFDQPEQLTALRRWTRAPMIYLKTIDEAGQPIDPVTLETVAAALAQGSAVEAFTGGRFGLAGIERGTETREGISGWITVKWPNPVIAGQCASAQVAVSGGWIQLNYLAPNCGGFGSGCNGSRMTQSTVRHELGHALGFWHTGDARDLMSGLGDSNCNLQASARERLHASIAYSRPIGNLDPDKDPTNDATTLQVTSKGAVVVIN